MVITILYSSYEFVPLKIGVRRRAQIKLDEIVTIILWIFNWTEAIVSVDQAEKSVHQRVAAHLPD